MSRTNFVYPIVTCDELFRLIVVLGWPRVLESKAAVSATFVFAVVW
jgi:hypothetical protein